MKKVFSSILKLTSRLSTLRNFYKHVCTLIMLLFFYLNLFTIAQPEPSCILSPYFSLQRLLGNEARHINYPFYGTDHSNNSLKVKRTLKNHLLPRWPSYLTSNTTNIDVMTDLRPGTPIAEIQWKIGFIVINGLIFITCFSLIQDKKFVIFSHVFMFFYWFTFTVFKTSVAAEFNTKANLLLELITCCLCHHYWVNFHHWLRLKQDRKSAFFSHVLRLLMVD